MVSIRHALHFDNTRLAHQRSALRPVIPWLGLVLSLLLIFGAPALISPPQEADKAPFDNGLVAQVAAENPRYVFIGNSMLDSRIDPEYLSDLIDGQKVLSLWDGGAKSSVWYLRLKNHVIASGAKPDRVFILFRARTLTDALERTNGKYAKLIEKYSHNDEPGYQKVKLSHYSFVERIALKVNEIYPVTRYRGAAVDTVTRLAASPLLPGFFKFSVEQALDMSTDSADTEEQLTRFTSLRSRANATFSPDTRRSVSATEAPRNFTEDFESGIDKAFLPLMLDEARDAGIEITFVRLKRRAEAEGQTPPNQDLERYMAELRSYLISNGASYIDLSKDPEILAELYLNGDHINPEHTRKYTAIFFDRARAYFDPNQSR